MNWYPTVSGYTTTLNCISHNYPWKACIESMLGFCNEIVVVDGGSTDGTWEMLEEWSAKESRIKILKEKRDWDTPRFAVFDGAQKALARSLCSSEFCWQQDADEVVHENDYEKVINLCKSFPNVIDLVSLPVVEYWGGKEKVRIDVNPWKWRLSRNSPNITHGIPKDMRKYDENGNLYASLGTDGCDYVDKDTFETIDHASFYISDAHNLRMHALNGNKEATSMYQEWITRNLELLPSVHHYSWFNLSRKIKTYRDYWSKHWQSLYDVVQEDTPENNMFFDKSWSDVSDDDISNLANDLKEKMGGWVFHQKVDFSKPTPHITLSLSHPEVINEWITD
jgi:glycosyltransferase involved in cell wall biosynthesis